MRDKLKVISALIAVGIYLLVVFLLLYYFNYRSSNKAVHYVKKNSDFIAVSLASSVQAKQNNRPQKDNSQEHKKSPKQNKVRNISAPNSHKKTKSKIAKKRAKTIRDLFASVSIKKKHKKKKHKKSKQKSNTRAKKTASQMVSESLKKSNNSDKGVENAYIASVEEKLKGWPAQANYAGEEISVLIMIAPNGSFRFKVKKLSNNSDFNNALIVYLKQLQSIGFEPQTYGNPYVVDVNFVATE